MKEFKDIFARTYKNLKGIPPKLAQFKIELDISIPLTHHVRYKLNRNYVIIVKQDINKLLAAGCIQYVEEATWLSPILIVPKKNGKLRIYINFKKLIVVTKKEVTIPITFYKWSVKHNSKAWGIFFLDGYLGHHQISIAEEDRYKIAFVTN